MHHNRRFIRHAAIFVAAGAALASPLRAQQANDSAYTAKIKEYLQDPRISTELVDHLPASATVPTPLKFLGRIVGTPGELTYAKDITRYFDALATSSPRVKVWRMGRSEEGREMIVAAIADEATLRDLDKYKGMLKTLTDPRTTSEEQARATIKTAKPIYWLTSGMHSPEMGGPEMLMELAYRLAVEETPYIQNIRNNVITFITPVLEVDGREKVVDTYYFNKKRATTEARLPVMYWGKYVQHDNNRDGMGQFLSLTKETTKTFLEWTPTVLHDLHEAQSYLYSSTGTGPYNEQLDPITINEWWVMAQNDVMEMAKRGVPGVFTYGFYDGWVPNYMFFVAHAHNSVGRFYEVQSYGPDNNANLTLPATTTSREWFRPNPPLPSIKWGPRNNTNIQESALLISLKQMADQKEMFLENYWLKNKRSVDKGRNGPTFGWVIPANQTRKANAADAINDLRTQGLEIHTATTDFKAGNLSVKAGDYIVRGDQPYRTLADMYFSLQNYPTANPAPYDDTGWTFQLMRNLVITPVTDKVLLTQPMTMVTGTVKAAGGVTGTGPVLIVDNAADNNLMAFRFKNASVKMQAAEDEFDAAGRHFRAGTFIIPSGDRATLASQLTALGLSGYAVASAPAVKMHDLDVPRIGYVHSWSRTQDEGWVRAALDTYGVPYSYFADQKLRDGNLRAKYDVIIFPHVGGTAQSQVAGTPKIGTLPLPYRKSDATPNLGYLDQSDDIRGGMGIDGLMNLYKFVEEGGTLITEGSTATIFPEYNLTSGITIETPAELFARGTILRGIISDKKSPLVYGYEGTQLPVYFNQAPVINAVAGGNAFALGGGGRGAPGLSQNVTPNATLLQLSPWDSSAAVAADVAAGAAGRGGRGSRGGGGGGGGGGFVSAAGADVVRPRIVMQFPSSPNDMLLSGTLAGGQSIAGKAQLVDAAIGKGHVVMFGIRPFWRWQTQGTYMLGFNAIMNWNDLDAGKAAAVAPARPVGGQ
ncbi:M14 family metallopeptidase [soil metagenome]